MSKSIPSKKTVAQPATKQKGQSGTAVVMPKTGNKGFETILHISLLTIVFSIVYYSVFDPKISLNGDNLFYYFLGKAIATGHGYVNLFSPSLEAHNHFPPGNPFIISLFMRLGIYDMEFYYVLNGLFALGVIIVFYLLIRKMTANRKLAFVVGLFISMNCIFLTYSLTTMSEIPYLLFSILSLYLLTQLNTDKSFYKNPEFGLLLVCVVSAYYIRSGGIVLLFSVLIHFLLKKKWAYAGVTVLSVAACVFPWYLRNQSLGGEAYFHQFLVKDPYDATLGNAQFHDFLQRFLTNIDRYVTIAIPNVMLPGTFDFEEGKVPLLYCVIGIAIFLLILYGMFLLVKKNTAIVIYVAGSLCMLLLWPTQWKDLRFGFPYMPFMLLFFLYALNYLIGLLLKIKNIPWNPYILGLGVILIYPTLHYIAGNKEEGYEPSYQNYFNLATWVKEKLPAKAIICCRKPELFYYFSDHQCVGYTYTKDDQVMMYNMAEARVDYVVVDQLYTFTTTAYYLTPIVLRNPDHFKKVYVVNSPDTYLYQFIK